MVWGSIRTAHPMAVKGLLGTLGAGLFFLALFMQPWVPIEIRAPETGMLVAMPAPAARVEPTGDTASSNANTPIDVPIAAPPDDQPINSDPVVQTAEVPAVPVPRSRIVPTYAEHIAPLINRHCVACHREADSKLRLTDSSSVQEAASRIAEATQSRRMPPWKPQTGFGQFRNERRLTEAEIALIDDWAKAGAPLGEVSAKPSPNDPPMEWVLGKPTVAYQLPKAFEVPVSEDGVTWNFVIPTGVNRELYLTAAELRPGNKALVKRMTLSFDRTGTAREKDKQSPEPGFPSPASESPIPSIVLAEWLPGMLASALPEGTAYHIPQGADLVLTVEYATTTVATLDPWSMGLHLTRTAPKQRLGKIEIDVPRARGFESTNELNDDVRMRRIANYTLPTDSILYSIRPEFPWEGFSMRAYAVLPSGESLPLLHIEKWDTKGQERYYFEPPISLPKDSRIVAQTWANDVHDRITAAAELRCEFEVSTPNAAHLEPLMRHNQTVNPQ